MLRLLSCHGDVCLNISAHSFLTPPTRGVLPPCSSCGRTIRIVGPVRSAVRLWRKGARGKSHLHDRHVSLGRLARLHGAGDNKALRGAACGDGRGRNGDGQITTSQSRQQELRRPQTSSAVCRRKRRQKQCYFESPAVVQVGFSGWKPSHDDAGDSFALERLRG